MTYSQLVTIPLSQMETALVGFTVLMAVATTLSLCKVVAL